MPPGARIPLTPPQARIWFFSQLYPDSNEYNDFDVVHLDSKPTAASLAQALTTLVDRHVALRLRFSVLDGEPVQQDHGPFVPDVAWHDLTDRPDAAGRAREIANACAREVLRPDEPPLCRFALIALPDGGADLVLGFHHVIADDWSWSLLLAELSALLAGLPLEPAAGPDFLDYAAWLQATTDRSRIEDDLAYWTVKLGGGLPILDLPADRPRPAVSSRAGHTVPVLMPGPALAAARRLADQEDTTLYVVLLAAYKVLLMRLSGQPDLVVGTAFAGRDHPTAERIFGCFVKSMALRSRLDPAAPFTAAVATVHRTVVEAQDHQFVPYEQIVAQLPVARDLSVDPVFQAQFALQSTDAPELDGVRIDPIGLSDYGSAKWDSALVMTETPDGLTGMLECSADLFDKLSVQRFGEMYVTLVEHLVGAPDVPVRGHPLISAAEQNRIRYELNPYRRPEHPYRSLAGPFEEQAARSPDAVAVVGEDRSLTYAELDAQANRLAHHLRAAGVRPGTNVALCLDRSIEMFVAIYAVAKSGGTYVPLDPELPDARIAFMLQDTEPPLVLTSAALADRVPPGPWTPLRLDAERDAWADQPASRVDGAGPGQCSHLLYTSGSTGRPKAVASAADGSIADILWMQQQYPYRPGDTALGKTSYGFDVSLWEICWPLYVGAKVVLCPPGEQWDVHRLADLIEQHQVRTVYIIPTQLQVFLDELEPGRCPSVRWMLSGGEPVPPRLRDACHAKLGAALVNGYGPTEAGRTTDMVIPRDRGNPVVPLGRPSTNFRLYVLDDELETQPVGVRGEAFIAAEVGLSHGYFRRPALTAEKFLPDPYGPPGGRMYRTGDVCRYRDDGVLEHLGRLGNQVKIRGMRIELSELEAVLCEQDGVDECIAVVVREDDEQHIVAFVVGAPGRDLDVDEVREQTASMLPVYMVPAAIQQVPAIPVNVNGKTDRNALLELWSGRAGAGGAGSVPPEGEAEEQLAAIFARVLELPEIGALDDFFGSGGHSLLVFKLVSACAEELGARVTVADVFAAPTVRQLAARISNPAEADSCLVPLAPRPGAPTVVLVHAASGSVLPFRELADLLADEYSVYGLQAPADGPASIEELARRYLEEVEPVRGLSPVCLVGWSVGGCIALEMDRQWAERSVSVAATVMLDSWPPPAAYAAAADRRQARLAIEELDIGAAEGVDLVTLGDEILQVTARNRQALLDYAPRPYAGRVYLLSAAEPVPVTTVPPPGNGSEWQAVVADVVHDRTPGNHVTLLQAEHAATLAATLRRVLAENLTFIEI